jgi:dihydrodipicolinate synthase/N-acetylneuraminate lyase
MHRAARCDGAVACRESEALYERFLPLETLRDDISLIRVLHDAVTLSDIADMGPILPLLSASPDAAMPAIAREARALLAFDESRRTR